MRLPVYILALACSLVSGAGHAQITFQMSEACKALLGDRIDEANMKARRYLRGNGEMPMIIAGDLAPLLQHPTTRRNLQGYASKTHASHSAVFIIIDSSVNHAFATVATTYLDNPSPFLMFSTDRQWLAIDKTTEADVKPIHMVIAIDGVSEWSLGHEQFHLDDLDGLHAFAQNRLTSAHARFILRMDIFLILTELRAYKQTYQLHKDSDLIDAEIDGLQNDVVPKIEQLSMWEWRIISEAFGLAQTDRESLKNYLTGNAAIPSIASVLNQFDDSIVTVMTK